jgi:hypothetical protein
VGDDEHELPLETEQGGGTSAPVDLDLINNVLRLPFRQRLSIVLGELGVGLAGRGEELREVLHRANPALRETDKVLRILARQNDVLAKLATDSDTVLAPLAREKERISDFVVQANTVAEASAERRADIEGTFERLPGFLQELRPLMADLEGLADEMTPVARDLNTAAPDVSRLIRQLGPFSEAARPALRSLGRATERGRPALLRTRPLIQDLGRFAEDAAPLTNNLDRLTKSLDETGGIERLMDYLFFQMIAINGFDGLGHYLRAGLIANLCSEYAVRPATGCSANFTATQSIGAGASRANEAEPRLASPGGKGGSVPPTGTLFEQLLAPEDDAIRKERERQLDRIRRQAENPSPSLGRDEAMLDYLLGGDQ